MSYKLHKEDSEKDTCLEMHVALPAVAQEAIPGCGSSLEAAPMRVMTSTFFYVASKGQVA